MDDMTKIPPLVLAHVRRHVVETEIRYETTVAANAAQPVTTTTSRRLRAVRDQLAEELAAWRYLERVASRGSVDVERCYYFRLPDGGLSSERCNLEAGHDGRHVNDGVEWS